MPDATFRRTDAKAFFANERTFLHWMSTSVTIGSIAAALSGAVCCRRGHVLVRSFIQPILAGVAGHAHRHWGDEYTESAILTRVISLTMLLMAIVMASWAGYNFQKRALYLEAKMDGPYDSRYLPVLLTIVMVLSLSVVFGGAIMRVTDES